jgi:hypothetical protein
MPRNFSVLLTHHNLEFKAESILSQTIESTWKVAAD